MEFYFHVKKTETITLTGKWMELEKLPQRKHSVLKQINIKLEK